LGRKENSVAASTNKLLIGGGALSGMAALAHLACLVVGAPLFRLLGAGEQIAQLHAAGHWYPTVVTLAIASVLAVWAAYALSAGGVIRHLPLRRTVLSAITAIYIARGVAFVPVMAYFPGNSITFWVVSSSICLAIGLVHLVGLRQSWSRLRGLAA
ncbi:hypothetical protein NY751_22255, partial [Xanthomonas campestris]|uniref:hypothetical protein n=1 Tax=Xanthomonas campestris TaxID=339 RepID=UPI002358BC4D